MTEPGRDLHDDRPSRYARPAAAAAQQSQPAAPEPPPEAGARNTDSARRPGRQAGFGMPRRALVTIFRLAGLPAAFAVAATIALAVALVRLEGTRNLAVNSWLLAIGGLVLWTCWRAVTQALPTAAASAFDSVRRLPAEPPSRLRGAVAIQGLILDAEWSWAGVEYGLRPLLRKLAWARLMERHQVDLESEPVAARRILGDELWALVGPGAYGPVGVPPADSVPNEAAQTNAEVVVGPVTERAQGHSGRGIPRATIKRAIELLEEL